MIETVRAELERGHAPLLLKRKLVTIVDTIAGDIEDEPRRRQEQEEVLAEHRRRREAKEAAKNLTPEERLAKRRAKRERALLAEVLGVTVESLQEDPHAVRESR